MGIKQRRDAIAEWQPIEALRDKARENRKRSYIAPAEIGHFTKLIAELRATFTAAISPAMPVAAAAPQALGYPHCQRTKTMRQQ